MANEVNKTTEILEFKVEQGQAFTDFEKLRKSMILLKEEQKDLQKAYKNGDISLDEYSKEITRVDTLLKKVSASHLQQQKAMAGVQTETSKLIKSNEQLTKSLQDSANQVRINGVSIGDLGSKLTALANPVTATVAIVGALAAAYGRSTIGAKDLAFAQAQLSNAITIVTNDFAKLISSAEDGEGTISKLTNAVIGGAAQLLGPAGFGLDAYFRKVAASSKEAALAAEQFEDLQREELAIREKISSRLAENQELLTEISDGQTSANQKAQDFSTIIGNLRSNQSEIVDILTRQRDALQKQLDIDKENEDLQTAVLQKNREIEKAKADTEKRIQAILRQEDNVNDANAKALQIEREKTSELERQARIATLERQQAGDQSPLEALKEENQIAAEKVRVVTSASKAMGDAAEHLADRVEASNERQKKSNEGLIKSQNAYAASLQLFASQAASFYQSIGSKNKLFAIAQLSIDAGLTLSGITRAAAGLDPKSAALYKASAFLSATASLAQAAKLIGAPNIGDIQKTSPDFIDSAGNKYVFDNQGKLVPFDENISQAQIDVELKRAEISQQRNQDISSLAGAIGTGAALGSVIPGLGTIAGAIAGGLIYGIGRLFKGRKKSGYASGGWTGPGDTYDVAGVVHADEYVVPKTIKNSYAAQPHLQALEQMRLRGYDQGGYVSTPMSSDMSGLAEMISRIQVYATIEDIDKAKARKATKMRIVTR